MKNELAIAALPGSHPLKIAQVEPVKTTNVLTIVKIDSKQKNSPYFKKFFQVAPAVQEETNWDNEWFSSYE